MFQSAKKSQVVDVGTELMKLTNNVICRVVASTSCSEEDDEASRIRELVKKSVELAGKMCLANSLGPLKRLGFWLYSNQAKEVGARYDQLLEKQLKEHERKYNFKLANNKLQQGDDDDDDQTDLMDIVLKAYHDHTAEFRITREQMKSFIADVLFAGTSAPAETMQWAIAEMINNPNIYNKARDEIESVVGTSRVVEETDISSLHYVQAIAKETLRLHPNAPFAPRVVCHHHCKINGFDIPKDTPVAVNLYSIMRDHSIWENPNEFCPDRFLARSGFETNKSLNNNFDFLPFGSGRRGCPGKNLAYILITTTIASVIQCLDWKVVGEERGDDVGNCKLVNMQEAVGLSVAMASPL